jgi:hypothetical protein
MLKNTSRKRTLETNHSYIKHHLVFLRSFEFSESRNYGWKGYLWEIWSF